MVPDRVAPPLHPADALKRVPTTHLNIIATVVLDRVGPTAPPRGRAKAGPYDSP